MSREDKKRIREEVKEQKNHFSKKQAEAETKSIFKQLESLPVFNQSKIILIYWAMPDEVQTKAFIEKWLGQKGFILPVIEGGILKLKELHSINQMIESPPYMIPEPDHANYFDAWQIDLAIVPGVAFSCDGLRLGRGRAYYDRLLKDMACTKIGICYSFQLYDKIPAETHDIAMDVVISGAEAK